MNQQITADPAPPGRPQFSAAMTVEQALALHPATRWVLAAYRLSGCVQCTSSTAETLEEVAAGYQLPLERLLADLNALFAE